MMKKHNYTGYVYLAVLVFYIWLAAQIPFCFDDWEWGSDIGIRRWLAAEQNSRYVGNFFVVIMTRSVWAKNIIMGAVSFLIPFLIMQIASILMKNQCRKIKLLLFLSCNAMQLTMSRKVWSQTFGWISGFANYNISALILLYLIYTLLPLAKQDLMEKKPNTKYSVWIFLVSLLSQLFLENLAIYLVLLIAILCTVSYFKHQHIPCQLMAMLAGAVMGVIVMFSSSLYGTLFSTGEAIGGYRRLYINSEDSIMQMVVNCVKQIIRLPYWIWENNRTLSLGILVVMSMRLFTNGKKSCFTKACMILNGIYAAYFLWHSVFQLPGEAQMYQSADGIADILFHAVTFSINVAYFFTIIVEILLTVHDKTYRIMYLFFWLSAPVIIAPLIVVSEYHSRLFFTSNVYQMVFLSLLICDQVNGINVRSIFWYLICTTSIVVILMMFYGKIYKDIGTCTNQRNLAIYEGDNGSRGLIVLPAYPHEDYLTNPNPTDAHWEQSFRAFYQIDDAVTIVFE